VFGVSGPALGYLWIGYWGFSTGTLVDTAVFLVKVPDYVCESLLSMHLLYSNSSIPKKHPILPVGRNPFFS